MNSLICVFDEFVEIMSNSRIDTGLRPADFSVPPSFPNITKPTIVGCFSLDEHRKYVAGTKNCKYVVVVDPKQRVKFDLNHGYENVIQKNEDIDEKLTHVLTFIAQNMPKLLAPNANEHTRKLLAADVVCFRGLLRLLMCTPYEQRENWIILAVKYRGTIYLCAEETEKHRKERRNRNATSKRILSYGFKFEQFMMSGRYKSKYIYMTMIIESDSSFLDKFGERPNINVPVNENEEFCCMFRTRLGNHELLYGAEMDGIESDDAVDLASADLDSLKFVELKVKLREERENQYRNYLRFKLRNWWCQSFLVNIKNIIMGTRNDKGIVDQVTRLDVRSIPKMAQVSTNTFRVDHSPIKIVRTTHMFGISLSLHFLCDERFSKFDMEKSDTDALSVKL